MIKLGQTTTGKGRGVEYMWLVKDIGIYERYSKKECYVVLGFTKTSGGWFSMFNGTLKACRDFIGAETVVDLEAKATEEPETVEENKGDKMTVKTLVEAMHSDMIDNILDARVYNLDGYNLTYCSISTLIDPAFYGEREVKRFSLFEDVQTGLDVLYVVLNDNYKTEGTPEVCADFAKQIEAWEQEEQEEQEEQKTDQSECENDIDELLEDHKKTVHGYTVIDTKVSKYGDVVALIDRNFRGFCCQPWVVAWCYDKNSDTWGQGHYFTEYADAVRYFNTNY